MSTDKEQLLNTIQTIEGLERIASLAQLHDEIEYNEWNAAQTKALLKILLEHFFLQPPRQDAVKLNIQRCLLLLLLKNDHRLSMSDFKPLIQILNTSQEVKQICPALNILGHSLDIQFLTHITPFLKHENEIIAGCAQKALALIQSRPRFD